MNKITSKILFALFMAILCGACSSEIPMNEAYGTVCFSIDSDASRAIDTSYDIDDFHVSVKQGETVVVKPKLYGLIQEGVLVKVGEGYQAYAESCSESEAESVNEGWGCIRYYGASEPFSVTADQAEKIDLPCGIMNAAVSVKVDGQVSEDYQLTLQASDDSKRNLVFNASTEGRTAYFNVSENREIRYTLTVDNTYSVSESFVIHPKCSYVLDIHHQTDSEITVSIGVVVDNQIEENDSNHTTFNPYGGD